MARKRTNYRRGVEIESKLMEEKISEGMESVRTAGSHGIFDVISWSKDQVIFSQSKREKKSPKSIISSYNKYSKDIYQISLTKTPISATIKELLVWTDYKGFTRYLII